MRARASFLAAMIAIALMWAGPHVPRAGAVGRDCTPAALNGLYEFTASGFTVTPSGAVVPKTILELIRFNGDGTLSVAGAVLSVNGVVNIVPPGGTGTYTVSDIAPTEAGCAGTLVFLPNGPHFAMFIRPDTVAVRMFQTDPNNVFQGTAMLVSP